MTAAQSTSVSTTTKSAVPAWLVIARSFKGTLEGPGATDNPVIMGWAKTLGGWIATYYTADSIPWCGLFAAFCVQRAGLKTPGDASLGAGNWVKWGQPIKTAVLGAVLVFERPGGHHVGFYEGEDDVAYHVNGGNESDSVRVERILKAHCIAVRWPSEVEVFGSPIRLAVNGKPISTNQA